MKLYAFDGEPHFKKVENGGKPAGVLITVPERFFKEYPGGEEQFRRVMSMMEEGGFQWAQTISGIPKAQVEFVYFVFGGKVQYRLTIHNYERSTDKSFDGTNGADRQFFRKNWVNLVGPAVPAPRDFFMRGFQGFRYTEFIF